MSSKKHQYGHLISEVKDVICNHFKDSIAEMFIKTDDDLFKMAEFADNNKDRNRYFELMRDTRALKDNISTDFIELFSHNLRPFAETAAEKKKLKNNNEDELSLMDQSEQEDMVLVKSMSDSIAGQCRDSLSDLEARLEHLSLQTPDIFYKKAIHPSNILQAFDDALGNEFDLQNKKTLFKFFNEHVALKLREIYDAINELLIKADILPQIKLHLNKSNTGGFQKRTPPTGDQAHADTGGSNDPEQDMNQGGYAMTAQPGHSYSGDSSNYGNMGAGTSGGNQVASNSGYGDPGHQGQVDTQHNNAHASAGNGNGSNTSNGSSLSGSEQETTTAYQHSTAGMPASQVGEVVGDYLGGTPLTPASENDSSNAGGSTQFFPAGTGQYYGHQEILNALSNVQHNPAFSKSEDTHFDGEAIKQAVLSEIAKTSGGGVTKSINRIAEKTIDFIELIFDAIIDDEDISDTIKTLLLRLQIPVIKASMLDQEFFIYDDHPARVLLDKIAHTGIGVTSHKDDTYIHLDKIVTTLVNEFELQADSFQTALDSLNNFLEKRETTALKKEEEAQRQVLREHARNTVLKSLRTATRGKILPETIHTLVLKRWPTMMYNHYLKLGKENDEWITIVDTLRSIINSVQPFSNINDLDHLISTRNNLIESTCNYLKRTNQSEEDIEQVLQDMREIHQSLIDQADFDEADEIPDDSTQNTASNDDIENEEDETPKLQLPSNIVPGMWFQIFNGEDKAQRRCKLSVVILEDQKLVFVNYQGEMIIEKELGEFLDEMANGKSKVVMGHSIFDHALSSVVNHLQKPH